MHSDALPDTSTEAGSQDSRNEEKWNVHFQATSVAQHHGNFYSKYEGVNSLPDRPENRVSLTATVFAIARLNRHFEAVVNPEIAGGKGFGDVTGIAGFTNGEIPRVAQAIPHLYLARGYLKGAWALGSKQESADGGPNQLAGEQPLRRFTIIAGRFAVTDFFDNNAYSHDPRSQFMNWALMSNGAWDYPADVRGYTYGITQELAMRTWSLRLAIAMEPTAANGPTLDSRITKNRGAMGEWEYRYGREEHSGKLRVLGFLNRERAGTFREAMNQGRAPDLGPSRRDGTAKYGFGINLEQSLTSQIGFFSRYGWSDGKTESWAFTQIDRSFSGGISVKGKLWKRQRDGVGAALVRNYLSGDQRNFLAAGGIGFIIGDGALAYRPEMIVEAYYAWSAFRSWTLTLDYQHIQNPAYNRDRGPVSVATLRLHWEG